MKITAIVSHASLSLSLIWVGTAAFAVGDLKASMEIAQNSATSKSKPLGSGSKSTKKSASTPSKAIKAPSKAKPPKGVVAKFNRGMTLFNGGKFEEALIVFSALHKEFPAHEPTIIQYAKTLYRLDRIEESYNLFARINPQYLDPETSYEYGYSFYIQSHFDGALYSFQRVPAGHPLYDLASYYGSMCAIRMKKYALAEELLDKAVVLPDKLARSKTLYQKHVASLRQLQEKTDLERSAIDEKQRMNSDAARAKNPPAAPPATPTAPAAPVKYVHKGFYVNEGSYVRLQSVSTNGSSDLHSYARKNYSSKTGSFQFRHSPVVELSLKGDNNRKAAVGANTNLAVTSVTTEGKKERLVANEDSQDIIKTLTENQPRETTTLGDMAAQLWAEAPLPAGMWIGADGHGGFTYPNFARGQRYGFRGASGLLGWKNSAPISRSVMISATYDMVVDSETIPVTTQTVTESTFDITLPMGLYAALGAKYILYNYTITTLPGPDSSVSGSLNVAQAFPLGITLALTGVTEQQTNYIARGLPISGTASADGQIMTGKAALSVAPVTWLTVQASHSRTKSTWVVKQVDRAAEFKAATPDYIETGIISGSINFNF